MDETTFADGAVGVRGRRTLDYTVNCRIQAVNMTSQQAGRIEEPASSDPVAVNAATMNASAVRKFRVYCPNPLGDVSSQPPHRVTLTTVKNT